MLVYFNKMKEVRQANQMPMYVMPRRVYEPWLSAVGLVFKKNIAWVQW